MKLLSKKMSCFFFVCCVANNGIANESQPPGQIVDILSIYQAAIDYQPQLKKIYAEQDALSQQRIIARSELLPSLALSGTYEEKHQDGTRVGLIDNSNIELLDQKTDTDTQALSIELRQPIFNLYAWRKRKDVNAEIKIGDLYVQQLVQNIALESIRSYFNFLIAKERLKAAVANQESIAKQLETTKYRYEAGMIEATYVEDAEAALDAALADVISAKHEVTTTSLRLEYLTGHPVNNLRPYSNNSLLVNALSLPLNSWIDRAFNGNIELKIASHSVEKATFAHRTTKARPFPTLDLTAKYGRENRESSSPFEYLDADEWKVGLHLLVPLYGGGRTPATNKASMAKLNATQFSLQDIKLATKAQVEQLYHQLQYDKAALKARAQAKKSAQKSLDSTKAGQKSGTRTTADVLDAYSRFLKARRDLSNIQLLSVIHYAELLYAAGELTTEKLSVINQWVETEP